MKQILLVFIMLIAFSTPALAQKSAYESMHDSEQKSAPNTQNNEKRDMRVGVNLAGNIAMKTYTDWGRYITAETPGFGGGVGAYFNIAIAKRFNFQAEVNYDILRHGNGTITPNGEMFDLISIKQYINVPMLFQYKSPNSMFFLNFGPELRFLLYETTKGKCRGYFYHLDLERNYHYYEDNNTSYYKPVVLAFNVGVGMQVPVTKRLDFVWETRFAFDITSSVRSKPLTFLGYGNNMYSLTLRAGVAYKF